MNLVQKLLKGFGCKTLIICFKELIDIDGSRSVDHVNYTPVSRQIRSEGY